MNCLEAEVLLSYELDGILDEAEHAALQEHLNNCPACRQKLAELREVVSLLQTMEDAPLPADFEAQLRTRLEAVEREKNIIPMHTPLWQKIARHKWLSGTIAACLILVVSAVLAGTLDWGMGGASSDMAAQEAQTRQNLTAGNAGDSAYDMAKPGAATEKSSASADENMAPEEDSQNAARGDYATTSPTTMQNSDIGVAKSDTESTKKKIIYTTYMDMKVSAVEDAIDQALSIVEGYGGYVVSSSNNQNQDGTRHYGNMTLRIPIADYDKAVEKLAALGEVLSTNKNGEDVSQEYYDTQARLKQYRAQEERYVELIKEAANVSEVLQVEAALNQVRAEIETMEARILYLNRLSDYGTVELSMSSQTLENGEISLNSWDGIGKKLGAAFVTSINTILYGFSRILVVLVYVVPILLILAVLAFIIVKIVKKKKKK